MERLQGEAIMTTGTAAWRRHACASSTSRIDSNCGSSLFAGLLSSARSADEDLGGLFQRAPA